MKRGSKKKKLIKALTNIDRLLEESYGKQLDRMERLAPNRQLRPKLKRLFFELNYLALKLDETADLRELETFLDENADALKKRIEKFNEQRLIASEIQKSQLQRDHAEFRIEALNLIKGLQDLEPSEDADETGNYLVADTTKVARSAISSVIGVLDQLSLTTQTIHNAMLKVDREAITRDMKWFRKKRRMRKYLKQGYTFFWGVVILGVLWDATTSGVARVFVASHFRLSILFAVAIAAINLYFIGPWFTARTIALERRNMKRSLEEFYTANVNVTFLVALKNKRIIPTKGLKKGPIQPY